MIVVREAKLEDESQVRDVVASASVQLRRVYRPTPEAINRKSLHSGKFTRMVACQHDVVIGTVEFRKTNDELHLMGLAVAPSHQRRGVARRIMDRLVQLAAQRECRALTLYTIKQTGNVTPFEQLGFRVVSEQPARWCESDHYDELDEVFMRLDLP